MYSFPHIFVSYLSYYSPQVTGSILTKYIQSKEDHYGHYKRSVGPVFKEQEANPVDLNSFFKEASPFVCVAVKHTADLFLKEPSLEQFTTAFLTLFLLCYRQRNKSIKEWVGNDFANSPTEEEKRCLKANFPWVEEQVAEAYLAFMLG